MNPSTLRVLVTGAQGLLGFHCRALLLARNGERAFRGEPAAFDVIVASRDAFEDPERLATMCGGCDIVLHLAGINRASPAEVEGGNERIAERLVAALDATGATPHVVYAGTTHSYGDSPYGRGKRRAGERLAAWARESDGRCTIVILPHLFGEGGRPDYNTVTATLCDRVATGMEPVIHDGAAVELLHAGAAAEIMLVAGQGTSDETIRASGTPLDVRELYERLHLIGGQLSSDLFPKLSEPLTLALYNTYRFLRFPAFEPREPVINADSRGELFELARGGGGGQTFLSWTKPGIRRGDHFHRHKVERFVVLEGRADIAIRRVFSDRVHTFAVSGERPVAVDMPTLHTHSIVNTGDSPLLTLFWAHEVFDPTASDTYFHPVLDDSVTPP